MYQVETGYHKDYFKFVEVENKNKTTRNIIIIFSRSSTVVSNHAVPINFPFYLNNHCRYNLKKQ